MPDPITPILPDPQASVDAALGSVPMGDETPLAFAAPTLNTMPAAPAAPTTPVVPETPKTTAEPEIPAAPVAPVVTPMPKPEAPKLEPMPNIGSSYLPPVPPAPISTPPVEEKPKKNKVKNLIMGLVAFLTLAGTGGYVAFNMYGTGSIPNISIVSKQPRNITDPGDCSGESNGGWLVWRNGECKVTGISGSGDTNGDGIAGDKDTTNPAVTQAENAGNASACSSASGVWCNSTDANGKEYGFCISNTSTKGCNQEAVDRGITIQIGKVGCMCVKTTNGQCDVWGIDADTAIAIGNSNLSEATKTAQKDAVNVQCNTQNGSFSAAGTEKFICKEGVKGSGDVVYSGGACTALNGKVFSGNLGCFCGTVQVDTGSGHTSYKSTCGCNEATVTDTPATHKVCNTTTKVCETVTGAGADTCTTDANCVTAAPVLACTGLTSAPATPVVGQTVTFTCAGTITPTGAATLSYKFRYSLDGGADQLLPNKTATTAELAISACGTYSVQCKVCATIAGVLKCDPTWQGAVQ